MNVCMKLKHCTTLKYTKNKHQHVWENIILTMVIGQARVVYQQNVQHDQNQEYI